MTIELDAETEALITAIAGREHISAAQLLKKLLSNYSAQKAGDDLLADIVDSLPDLPTFKGNPLDIQREMRNEWD